MKRLIAAVLAAVLAPLLTARPAMAAPKVDYVARAVWISTAKNTPEPGRTTLTKTTLLAQSVSRGYEVCVLIEVSEEANSGRGDRTGVKDEDGCTIVPRTALTVAADLSTATLDAPVRLTEIIRSCPPETPNDCVFTDGPSRTVTVSVTWTAIGAPEQVCLNPGVGPLAEFRDAVATGTLGGVSLGSSEIDPELTYVSRTLERRC